jgi:tetratricopeptide (TPR) repeat protein
MVNIAWYTLEAGYQDDEHLKRALECARKAVELDEGTPNAWHRHSVLGRVYLAKGQLDGAKRELKEAIQLNKRASQSYFFLAKVHLELGELREAKKALAEFLNRPSRSPWYGKARETAITLIKEISDQLERADDAQ